MKLPKLSELPKDSEGHYILTESEYDALMEEANIAYYESGASYELDNAQEDFETNWVSNYLGTDNWYCEATQAPQWTN